MANDAQWLGGTAVNFLPSGIAFVLSKLNWTGAAAAGAAAIVITMAMAIAVSLLLLEAAVLGAAASAGHPITGIALAIFLIVFNFLVVGTVMSLLESPLTAAEPVALGVVGGMALFFAMETYAFGSCQNNSTCWASTGL